MQKFYVDDYFHIGHMHLVSGKPCQDYSFSGLAGNGALAVVSDGCSTGRHTDIGSRVTALSTVNVIRQHLESQGDLSDKIEQLIMRQNIIATSKFIDTFGLELRDMLATCVYALLAPGGGLIGIYGDGVIAKVYKDGTMVFCSYQWDDNTPLYPAYALDNYRGFVSAHGEDLKNNRLTVERCFYRHGQFQETSRLGITLGDAMKGIHEFISPEIIDGLSFLAIFTDGVMQVEGISWQDVVLELLAFKNLNGDFVKRRMIRFIKDSKKDGKKGPLDDIACAIIRTETESIEEGV